MGKQLQKKAVRTLWSFDEWICSGGRAREKCSRHEETMINGAEPEILWREEGNQLIWFSKSREGKRSHDFPITSINGYVSSLDFNFIYIYV